MIGNLAKGKGFAVGSGVALGVAGAGHALPLVEGYVEAVFEVQPAAPCGGGDAPS